MKRLLVYVSMAIIGTGLLGYSAWSAWDNGWIGKNPRAPTAEIMSELVSKLATTKSDYGRPSCVSINFSYRPEQIGIDGIQSAIVPGQYAITLLKNTNIYNQPVRDLQIETLNYLVSKGIFTSQNTLLAVGSETQPAIRYDLTWAGYSDTSVSRYTSSYGDSGRSSPCFKVGDREFDKITKITRLPEKIVDLDVYEVVYQTKVVNTPDWLLTAEAKKIFTTLEKLTASEIKIVKLLRGKSGWLTSDTAQNQLRNASNTSTVRNTATKDDNFITIPAPTLDEAKKMVVDFVATPDWITTNGTACFPFEIHNADGRTDTRNIFSDPYAERQPLLFALDVTYYDSADVSHARKIAPELNILSALTKAKLVQPEILDMSSSGGVHYRALPEAIDKLGISSASRYGRVCLPIGKWKFDVLAVTKPVNETYSKSQNASIIVKATIEQVPDWVKQIAEDVPAVQAMIKQGVPVLGSITTKVEGVDPATVEVEKTWRLASFSPVYPQVSYNTLPADLAVLMPETAAALSKTSNTSSSGMTSTNPYPVPQTLPNAGWANAGIPQQITGDEGTYRTDSSGQARLPDTASAKENIKRNRFEPDTFQMPKEMSAIASKFVLTSKIDNKTPVDNLDSVFINSKQQAFYVYVKMTNIESDTSYHFRLRVLDAKKQLVWDKTLITAPTKATTTYANSQVTPMVTLDVPGEWTFQGMLDGKKLFEETRKINY